MQTSFGRVYDVGKGTEAIVKRSMIVIEGCIGEGSPIKAAMTFLTANDFTAVEASKVL